MTKVSPERTAHPPAATAAALAEQLHRGERLLWSGRPPQDRLVGAEVRDIAVGLAMIAGGLVLFDHSLGLPQHGVGVGALGLTLALLGGLVIMLGVHLKPARRRRTWYGVTKHRLLLVQQGDFVLSYLLRGLTNVTLEQHSDGTGSIRLAATMPKSSRGRTLPPWRAFEHLHDAEKVYRLIQASAANLAAAPIVSGAAAEPARPRSNEAVAYGRHRSLDYYEPVRAILKPGESPIWVGRPPTTLLLLPTDARQMLASIVATMLLVVDAGVTRFSGAHIVAGVLLLHVVGTITTDARARRRAWYAVTDRRCVIVTEGNIVESFSLWPAYVQGLSVQYHRDGRGTILFLLSAAGWEELRGRTPRVPKFLTGPSFRWIDDPRGVQDSIIALLTAAPRK